MKKILAVMVVMAVPSFAANACLDRATNSELLSEISRRMGGGGGGGDNVMVDSTVDLPCVETLGQRYPYQPDRALLISWAGQCRTNVDGDRCSLISSQPNSACVDRLVRMYPFQPDQSVLQQFSTACLSKKYSCPTTRVL
jgi:hypothetical protein